jgi:5-methylcytosine-specific restriction endonuclease McrA
VRTNYKLSQSVCYEPLDAHQAASLVMLNRSYASKDVSIYNWKIWLKLRDKWMKEQIKLVGGKENLTCAICGRKDLDPWTKNKSCLATIDHIVSVHRAPHLWNVPSNFQLTCRSCNEVKGCS